MTPAPAVLSPDQLKARGRRNVALALALVAFIVIVFLTTFMQMRRNLEANAKAAQPSITAPADVTPATEGTGPRRVVR